MKVRISKVTSVIIVVMLAGFIGCEKQENPVGNEVNLEQMEENGNPENPFQGKDGDDSIMCLGASIQIAWPLGESSNLWTGWQGTRTEGAPSNYGGCGYTHCGADYYARDLNRIDGNDYGKNVYAGFYGQVVQTNTGYNGGYGNTVVIYRGDIHVAIRYSHLSQILVSIGQWVNTGQLIGKVGNTGYSTAPHLHLAAYENIDHFYPNGYPVIPTVGDSQWYTCIAYFYWW